MKSLDGEVKSLHGKYNLVEFIASRLTGTVPLSSGRLFASISLSRFL